MIKLLIVDDSKTETLLLKKLFESDPEIEVIGCAKDGNEAVELNEKLKPDVITMDLEMPSMDGHTATRLIMSQNPKPIVVISSKINKISKDVTYLALEAGAVSVLPKPDMTAKNFPQQKKQLIATVRSMAEIKVIKRRFNLTSPAKTFLPPKKNTKNRTFEIIVIGSSVGGPQTLKTIFSQLPRDIPVPIVVVQHMTSGFIEGFTKWLSHSVSLPVKSIEDCEVLKNGTIYFAVDHFHLTIQRQQNELIARLLKGDPVSGFCPSITVVMQSVAKTCGKNAIGVLLTGMGNDGAQGLLEMKKAGAHTLIQDKKSCVVFGMAGIAQSLGAVDTVVELDQMAEYLTHILKPSC